MPDPDPASRPGIATTWISALAMGLAVAVMARRPFAPTGQHATVQGSPSPAPATATPAHFTRGNWRDILLRVYAEVGEDRVLAVAAGVTFYVLLAIFPAVTALVSLYGLVADPATISDQIASLSALLPSGALDILSDQVKRIASKPHGSLGFGFVAGLAVALWSTNAGMKAMFDALNVVYEEKEKRGFVLLNAVSLACTAGALVVVMAALGAVVAVPVVLAFASFSPALEAGIGLVRWPVLMGIVVVALAVLYRVGPSRRPPKWRWVSWGSGIAAVAWLAGSMVFSWYVGKFGTYNETYGSLGAAIGFMTWIWISTSILLLGAEINAEMEHQTPSDTTTGPGAPRGGRGATMADDVAT